LQHNLVSIEQLSNKSDKDSVDILGVVASVGVLGSITTKKGEPLSKRVVSIYDQSNKGVRLSVTSICLCHADYAGCCELNSCLILIFALPLQVDLTLWGDLAASLDEEKLVSGSIVLVRRILNPI
jgi:hypothetical protein